MEIETGNRRRFRGRQAWCDIVQRTASSNTVENNDKINRGDLI